MCTAIRWKRYFGRTLDLEYSYEEQMVVMPRRFSLSFRRMGILEEHYTIIGVAYVAKGYPLYYDGVNEKGLAMAGLNFPENACYHGERPGWDNVTPFELIPWVLGQCASVAEAKKLLERVNLLDESFSPELPLTPQHWMIADRECSLVVEPMTERLRIYENPTDVLTNNPPFPGQLERVKKFAHLTSAEPDPDESDREAASRGLGAVGLPGDWSSQSRFARASFVRAHAQGDGIGPFFRMMGSVEVPEGCITLKDGRQVRTVYTSACDLDRGIYYCTTCGNHQIQGMDMHREDLNGSNLICRPMLWEEQIGMMN